MRKDFKDSFRADSVSFWEGLEVGDVPPTPSDSTGVCKPDRISENLLFDLADQLGMFIQAYREEKSGAMIHNVIPVKGRERSYSNEGSFEFPMHVEAPHLEERPDYLALLCLRGHPDAVTLWAEWGDVENCLTPHYRSVLEQPLFLLRPGESWGKKDAIRVRLVDGGSVRLNLANVQPIGDDAAMALNQLRLIFKEAHVVQRRTLKTGDLLLISNRRCVHGRKGFFGDYDGSQRWIQRAYLRWPI